MTQTELARFAGVRQGTISKLETGALRSPSSDILDKLAYALRKCGRKVDGADLQPRRQPRLKLVKGARARRRERRVDR